MSTGIRDKVAIVGMGCTRFGERWDVGAEELMVEAYTECIDDAGIDPDEIQAAWLGSWAVETNVGKSATPLATTLHLPQIPVTRVENLCTTGTEALRGAAYAVASGAYDTCLALGVEKLKDTGYGGLANPGSNAGSLLWMWLCNATGPGCFAQLATGYQHKYSVQEKDLKRAMAQVSVKSHENGSINPKAHLRFPVTIEQVLSAPIIAYPLGLFDCCGVSDGAACAIVTTVEKARDMGIKNPVTIKGIQIAVTSGEEMSFNQWDVSHVLTTERCCARLYEEAGITNPKEEIRLLELHDCFSITEIVSYEDIHLSERGEGWRDALDGKYNRDGKIPCQTDGGLKCFGHPIGASGLRMAYEVYLQLLGRAGDRQIKAPRYGLTQNIGGLPAEAVCSLAILGRYND